MEVTFLTNQDEERIVADKLLSTEQSLTKEQQSQVRTNIGAIGAEELPSALPNPHKLTFTGAVNAEYDGSEAVEVNIPAGGGAEKQGMELLTTVTVSEDVARVDISQCDDGTPFADKKLTRIGVFMKILGNSAVTTAVPLSVMANVGHPMYGSHKIQKMISSSTMLGAVEFRTLGRVIYAESLSDSNRQYGFINANGSQGPFPTINSMRFFYDGGGYVIPAGSTFEVWGC